MRINLSGRAAVIAGGSTGLGRAIAQGLGEAGCDVLIGARREDVVQRAAAEIASATGARVIGVAADISRAEGVERLLEAARTHFGQFYVLVANAGAPPSGSPLTLSDAEWEQAFHQNFMSVVRLIRGAVPVMREHGGGRIITIVTTGVKVPILNQSASNAFRSGVVALTKTMSFELSQYGILINNLAAGRIRTERTRAVDEALAKKSNRTAEEIERAASIPVGRYGDPREFANVAVFLASEHASYITGTTLCVDGGATRALT